MQPLVHNHNVNPNDKTIMITQLSLKVYYVNKIVVT